MKRKRFSIATMISVVLLTVAFIPLSGQQSGSYDPWLDLNDDGIIDVNDLQALASVYGTSGGPINKTALLLELQARVDSLNASLIDLKARINSVEKKLGQVRIGYVSVPASAFQAQSYGVNWNLLYWPHSGDVLIPLENNVHFFAPIQLPDNATVTRFTYYFLDSGTGDTEAKLIRSNFAGTRDTMATVSETGTPGIGSDYDDTINFASIDNSHFSYYVDIFTGLFSGSGGLGFYGVTIEYEYQA